MEADLYNLYFMIEYIYKAVYISRFIKNIIKISTKNVNVFIIFVYFRYKTMIV